MQRLLKGLLAYLTVGAGKRFEPIEAEAALKDALAALEAWPASPGQ
jgi:hypothetical protein